jgi:hypothetical protein
MQESYGCEILHQRIVPEPSADDDPANDGSGATPRAPGRAPGRLLKSRNLARLGASGGSVLPPTANDSGVNDSAIKDGTILINDSGILNDTSTHHCQPNTDPSSPRALQQPFKQQHFIENQHSEFLLSFPDLLAARKWCRRHYFLDALVASLGGGAIELDPERPVVQEMIVGGGGEE